MRHVERNSRMAAACAVESESTETIHNAEDSAIEKFEPQIRRHQQTRRTSDGTRMPLAATLALSFLLLLQLSGLGDQQQYAAEAFSTTTPMTPFPRSSSAFSHKASLHVPGTLQLAPFSKSHEGSGRSPLRRTPSISTTRSLSTKLETTSEPLEEDDETIKSTNIFKNASNKFKARPGTYLMIPVIAAFVGWFTNYLAVQMIFYPVQFKGIALWRRPEIPLGLLGWQGIVPCKTITMSKSLVEMVTSQLLTIPEAFERLNPTLVARHLAGAVPQLGEEVILDCVGQGAATAVSAPFPLGLWRGVFGATTSWFSGIVRFCNVQVLKGVVKDLIRNSERIFSLENCVVDQMVLDRGKLGQLFQKVGSAELDFLTNSGLWFGFLLGLIQMAVALVWDNPWALSIGGMIVGLATNWLALKWIFEPVYPTKIGPFVVQGMFLKRQKEVAAEFSKFFASKIITSEQIWNSILTDKATRPALTEVLGNKIKRLLRLVTFGGLFSKLGGMSMPSSALIGKITGSAVTKLPGHLTKGLHRYVDGALQLETTLRVQMEAMSPAKFERVLHPIFEEDELTLIIAGGILGLMAGLVQQGLETGAIQVPPLPEPIQKLLAKVNSKKKAILGNIKGRFGFGDKNEGGDDSGGTSRGDDGDGDDDGDDNGVSGE